MRKMYSVFPAAGKLAIVLVLAVSAFSSFGQSTVLISPTGDGGFENGAAFVDNGWTVVNGTSNRWFLGGVSTPASGSNAAYISDNATGATYNFNNGAATTVHFYRDVTFPAGQTEIYLTFKWKAQGEGNYDYVTVFTMPTSVTPAVNSPVGGFQSWLNIPTAYPGAVVHATPPNLNLQGTYQTQTICLPASYAGTTRRLVFMWTNDGSLGTQPPGSIDDISLTSATSVPPTAQPTSLSLTPVSTSQINGTFTAAPGSPTYLVVAYPTGATPVSPSNGSNYSVGSSLGTGTVVYNGAASSFNATALSGNTTYDFYIYSYTALPCSGNQYLTTSPLTGTASTNACGGLAGGTYTVGPSGTYPTLTAAIAATAVGMTGPVVLELQSTYNSGSETFPLVFGYNACIGPVNTLTIRPATGATGLSISGDNATAIIDFDGGDYVTIDGRPGGAGTAQELSIVNTNTTGVAVRFINDAKNNTLSYLDIQGASDVTPTTSTLAGVVFFAGAGSEATGNDNNTIANSKIHSSSGGPVAVGVYSFGSTTTVASYNDNNTITNTEIFDVFKAGASSTAIKLDAGNNAWVITNNHIYQSAPYTYSAAATHRGIWITPNTASISNTASGFTITGNNIGGSGLSLAAPAYTMSGAFAYGFMGMDISAGLGTATSVQNNAIGNISMTTSATSTTALVGINIANGNVNVGTVTGNTIGSQAVTGDIQFITAGNSGGVMGIRVAAGGTINIANNTIGGIDLSGSVATATTNFSGINIAGAAATIANISNNTVGSPNVANSINMLSVPTSTTSATFNGINITSGATTTVNGNVIANINTNNAYSGTATMSVRGIIVTSSATSINNNIIRNLSSSTASTATGSGSAIVGIAMTSTNVAGATVTGNIIDSLVITSSNATAAIQVTGLFFSGTATVANTIQKNFIHSFDYTNANPNVIFTGIDNAAGANNIMNNMIRLGIKPDGTDYINDNTIRGISSNSTANTNIYHNSIYIGGANVGSNPKNTYAFIRTSTSGTYDIRNNILVNNRSNTSAGSGGFHYVLAFTNPASGSATAGVTVNNNVYQYTGNDGIFAGYLGTTPPPDVPVYVAGWLASDAGSVVGDPQFIAPTGTASTVNLHIHPTNPTPIEASGALIALVTEDFDGQVRSGLTPSDIGADAGDFVILDIAPPVISYTALANSCTTGDRTITATINDGTGLPTAGANVPRIYFKQSTAGAWQSAPGTLTSGNGNNGVWDFTISSAAMGGVNNLDIIEYFIIAQDNAGNVGSVPGGVDATSVNGPFTTYPTPATYAIAVLNGVYSVGSASTAPFTTLTSAANFYNNACITGPVIFELTDAAYDGTTETFPITFNANATASATNTLTVRPAAAMNTVISGSSAGALIKLNGADYIIIEGSNNNTNSRDLTIANTSTAAGTSGIWMASLGTGLGATNDTIRNTIIKAGSRTVTSTYGIYIGGTTVTTTGTGNDNDNIAIINDSISFAYTGLYARAATAGVNDNLAVIGNSFGSETAAEYLGKSAIDITNATGANIAGNRVTNIIGTITNPTAMFIGTGVVNSTITRNQISKIHYTGTSGYGGRAMDINTGSATTNLTISNNMIWDIKGDSWTTFGSDAIIGIRVLGTTGGLNFYHNTISLGTGTFAGSGSGTISGALYFASTVTAIDLRNNILHTNLVNSSASSAKTYALYSDAPAAAFTNINHNNYFAEGTQGVLAYIGSPRTTLADIQAGFGQNLNSLSVDPEFISPDDLHLQPTSPMDGAGTWVGVTIDIDLETRDLTTPDIGADELPAPVGIDMRPLALVSPIVITSGCYNTETITVSVKNNSQTAQDLTINPVTVQVTVTLPSSASVVYSAVLNTGTLAPGAVQNVTMTTPGATMDMSAPGIYSFEITTSVTGGADVNPGNNTITETRTREALTAGTAASTPESYCVTGGAPRLSTTGAIGYSSLQWEQSTTAGSGFGAIAGATGSSHTVSGAITQTMYYRLIAYCGLASDTSNEIEVAIFNPSVTGTTPATRCGTGTVQLGATGSSGTTLNWYTTATGGTAVGTGTTFTTPSITSTTTYFVAASNGGAPFTAGRPTPQAASGGLNSTDYGIVFDATQPFTITSAQVYPTGTAGSMTVELLNNTNTVIATAGPFSIPAGTGTTLAGGATPVTLNLNLNVPVGSNFKLRAGTVNVSLIRDNPVSGWSYPLPIGSVGTITAGWAFGSASTATYYYFYNLNIGTGCESARTAVEATVTAPPALTVTAGATICNNAVHQLQVTSTVGDFDSYIWTPTTGLFTDAAATVPYTGTSATTVYVKNSTAGVTTYTLNASNSVSNCANVATSIVTVMPNPTITSSVPSICNSGTATLSLNPASGYGAGTFQWQTSADGVTYGDIATATGNSYTTPTLTQTTYYKLILKDGAGATCSEPTITVTVNVPLVTGTTPGSRCGTGPVTLGATGSAGTTLAWYETATGGTAVGTGTSFTTPSIGSTTNYYVEAGVGASTMSVGRPAPASASNLASEPRGLIFNANQPFLLNSITVYSTSATAGTATIEVRNSSNVTILGPLNVTWPGGGSAASPVPHIIPVNFNIPQGANHRIFMTQVTTGGISYEFSGISAATWNAYKTPGNEVEILASITSYTGTPSYTTYYYFYDWQVSVGCASARTMVTATVNTPASNTAGSVGTTECGTENVSGATMINYTDCDPIATITPSGASPVSGNVTACVTIDNTIQQANGDYYVQRHYDITPATDPATSTATVTLYFLQSEFNAYNAVVNTSIYPPLPTGPADATGIANLRITQFHGSGTNPGNYTGSAELIDPADADIIWNPAATKWEVTFAVSGFSGFYVHTRNFVLPVTGLDLKGEQSGAVNRLAWKTLTEINNLGFELQRSADGTNYSKLAFVASKAENGNSTLQLNYQYNDDRPFAGSNYYRLKQLDKDGKFSYSNVVLLSRKVADIMISRVYPNPTERELKLMISSPRAEKVTVIITDLTGKVVMQQPAHLVTGENQQVFNVTALSAGTYLIKAICGNGCETTVHRFVKQ